MKVYEVIDASSDEMYFPMGIFLTLEGAKRAILELAENTKAPVTEYGDESDYESIRVDERETGWSGKGEPKFSLIREKRHVEELDDILWVVAYNSDER